MCNHAKDCCVNSEVSQCCYTKHHEAHMSDGRERYETFHIGLREAT